MEPGLKCSHEPCTCQSRRASRFCSTECESAAKSGASDCPCGHKACHAKSETSESESRDIGGNQGEGNREADRRYREAATEFARKQEKKRQRSAANTT